MVNFKYRDYSTLADRNVFNRNLRHIVHVSRFATAVEQGRNLADLLQPELANNTLSREQIPPILSVLLIDRFRFYCRCQNLVADISNFDSVVNAFSSWDAVDVVAAYHHPDLGVLPLNPAVGDHWANLEMQRNELIVVYARSFQDQPDLPRQAVGTLLALLAGLASPEEFSFNGAETSQKTTPRVTETREHQTPQWTPKYSVQVTNELFHNGNVEAWKNIIESYHMSHAGCQVHILHEGERILDLNSLFQWGKVKHGELIFFQVEGGNLRNLSRLQKYLHEGASPRFDAFLKWELNQALKLF